MKAAVALLLLAGIAVALTSPGGPPRPATTRASGAVVTRAALACPDPVPEARTTTSVRLGLADLPGVVDGGSIETGSGDGRSQVPLGRGRLSSVATTGGPSVRATGAAAAGLFGFRIDRHVKDALAVAGCGEPQSQWWFTGVGAGLDHASTLLLANLDSGPAVVDLRVLGPDGVVTTAGATGLVVRPGTVRRVALADVAPQTDELALSVHTERGRVTAAVDDSFRSKPAARPGREWLAGSSGSNRPARSLLLAGVPARADRRTLLVANPTDDQAVVDVRLSDASGTFTPTGLGPVTVAPGAVTSVDLTGVLRSRTAVAVRVTSSQPLLASLRSVRGTDHAYATAVEPIVGAAAAPAGSGASVQLTAGGAGAHPVIEAYDAGGRQVGSTRLVLDADATRSWSPPATAAYVLVTRKSAAGLSGGAPVGVSGGVSYARRGLAAVPLESLPWRVARPTVLPADR